MVRFDTSDRAYAEISILVDPLFQGKGVGSLILQHSVEYALNHLDLLEIHAWIHISNIASRKLFTKCGFVKVRSEGFFDFYKLSNLI
jgi:RimJ/RimL family protein N-acetyltransferase